MKKLMMSVFVYVFLFSGMADAALITFDEVGAGTIITNRYASLGVVFSIDHPTAQPITAAGQVGEQAISPPNWLTNDFDPTFSPQQTLRATFVDPDDGVSPATTTTVSFTYISDRKGAGRLEAYDAIGNLLDQSISVMGEDVPAGQVTPGPAGDEEETLSVSATDISYVLIYPELDVLVDNFTFAAQPVPEPSTFLLLGTGLIGLLGYGWQQRRKKQAP